ncbi:alpha-mannosidase [Caldanaerobius fijiensis DSM 17918]|uniref:Alpha-mannosidase n=1 Tax=Caldanaerobius fijiensis DSM 17918 TaxID=1121256 RepID=A0A1M4SWZ4_9THEO|nr:alpha-mannosidase [Caldanaerobius fijiensis]SHE36658.1 alpha-mannosidase [Caldanaerobius fijiensis DSM 17918]
MYFTIERIDRILRELKHYIYSERLPIESYKVKPCGYGDYELLNSDGSDWETFRTGDRWGGRDKHFWFKTQVVIPEKFEGKTVVFNLSTGREGEWDALNPQFLIYVNGKMVQGLDVNHREVLLCERAKAGEVYNIDLYAYAGMSEGLVELNCNIAVLEKEIEKLYYNIKVPLDIAKLLDKEDLRSINILKYMTDAVNKIDLRKPFSESFYASIKDANDYLEEEFYKKYCGNDEVIEICVGHTHIDVAWLWTLAQTREKAARSFATVINLMKQYPEYIFMSSQPQLYKFIKEDHPELYEEIKKMVKEGRWEPEGAMWLEADCNLTSGESLVRQILFGTRFFKNEFGVESKILWLPDVFGYSAALPQILKKSGIDYFMTTKISWNEYNKLPYDTFMWRGIDGTEVLTHFISTRDYTKGEEKSWFTTYNGFINPSQVMGCWQRYQQKDINNQVLNCFGYGDGGGGPTKEMLENARRLAKGIPGCPKVKMGKALDFFKELDKRTRGNKKLPKWVGELYLEYHRGTYTSIARNKKYNRKTEFLNLEAELFSTMNKVLVGGKYPQDKINECWEITLLNQFHDIIPGSSIKEVYEDSRKQYEKINAIGRDIVNTALENISSNINISETSLVVFNQLSFERSDIVKFELPQGWTGAMVYDGDKLLPSQVVEGNKVIFFAENVPSKGYKTYVVKRSDIVNEGHSELNVGKAGFENRFFNIRLDENGNITSIYDKINERQVLKENQKANVLQAFEDKPHNYDAWDINIYYQEKMWEINDVESIEVVENGPVRAALKIKRKFLDSTIEQIMYIYNDIPRIDFATRIDWKEKQILLKAAFPVDIHADKATYEIQYGNVERPTHWNTSWDYARFEVPAHKWVDLSEGGYGVSLLNDCKYGHDIKDSVMRLTLLKSATQPNVDADREVHEFTYSLYPHSGDWKAADVVSMAYNLNCPMYAKVEAPHEGTLPAQLSLLNVDKSNVVVEVVKKAEDSDDIIVRMYECYNTRTKVKFTFFKQLERVAECDLMENEVKELDFDGNTFSFEIKPYEIKTFKLSVK